MTLLPIVLPAFVPLLLGAVPLETSGLTLEHIEDWRVLGGDDPAFASPEFDDSDWQSYPLGSELGYAEHVPAPAPEHAVVWFRTTLLVKTTTLALSVGTVAGTYDLYVDGRRLDGWSRLDRNELQRAVSVPPELLADGKITIALRTFQPLVIRAWKVHRTFHVPFAGPPTAVRREAEQSNRLDRADAQTNANSALMFLLLAVYHLFLYGRRREQSAYLWFGLQCIVVALGWYSTWQGRAAPSFQIAPVWLGLQFGPACWTFAHVCQIEFAERLLFGRTHRSWRPVELLLVVVAFLALLPTEFSGQVAASPLRFVMLSLVNLAFTVRVVAAAVTLRTLEARIVGVGVLLSTASQVYLYLTWLRWVERVEVLGTNVWIIGTVVQAAAMVTALAVRFANTLDTLEATNAKIGRFVPTAFLERLGRSDIVDVERGDSVASEMTVLFADLRGFTSLAEELGPQRTFERINRHLADMEPLIAAEGGFINQYYGDGIMALFSDADSAVRAARAMLKSLSADLRMGIGVNTGPLMLGTIGGPSRLDTGVVGDAVNVAARLEALTKEMQVPLLVSEATHVRLQQEGSALVTAGEVALRGRGEPTGLYRLAVPAPRNVA